MSSPDSSQIPSTIAKNSSPIADISSSKIDNSSKIDLDSSTSTSKITMEKFEDDSHPIRGDSMEIDGDQHQHLIDNPIDQQPIDNRRQNIDRIDQHDQHDQNDETSDDSEREHFRKILDAFQYYRRHSERELSAKLRGLRSINGQHSDLVSKLRDHIRQVHRCTLVNYRFLREVARSAGDGIFENIEDDTIDEENSTENSTSDRDLATASEFNMDKLRSTLRQIVRDWSDQGQVEREQSYRPILDYLIKIFPSSSSTSSSTKNRREIRILVPGAGLGRLALEIARLGFTCQGNEFSLFMLFVSNFVLNRSTEENEWTIYPYVHQWTNNWTYDDQLRAVRFPDLNPMQVLTMDGEDEDENGTDGDRFSMTAGDFLDVYRTKKETDQSSSSSTDDHRSSWHAVCTVFFLDTARNPIDYMETIRDILTPGGYWLNFGPLLYHYADMPGESSVELPYEEILTVAEKMGFEILTNERAENVAYTQNSASMLQYKYNCAFTVFRKKDG